MERWVICSAISVVNLVEIDSREGCLRAILLFGAKKKKKKKKNKTKKIRQTSGIHIS